MDVQTWINKQLLSDTISGLRVGQSYMIRVKHELSNPKLFYETCLDDAWAMIWELEDTKNET